MLRTLAYRNNEFVQVGQPPATGHPLILQIAMCAALKKLGYNSYHFLEIPKNKKDAHMRCWMEGLKTKLYGGGELYGKEDFDRLLGKYSVSIHISIE